MGETDTGWRSAQRGRGLSGKGGTGSKTIVGLRKVITGERGVGGEIGLRPDL